MPLKPQEREYRAMVMDWQTNPSTKRFESDYYAEGYATTFNDPYLLYDTGEFKLYEQISPDVLIEADISDVKFQVNHEGTVYARRNKGTLDFEVDSKGIFTFVDLSKTSGARARHEEIAAGYIDKMSWAFTVARDSYQWNEDMTVCLRNIERVKKVYEFSAVTLPANPNTDMEAKSMPENKVDIGAIHIISARNLLDGVIESREQELLKRKEVADKKRKQAIRILLELED